VAPGKGGFDVPSGGRIHLHVPGSGGYGVPRDRDIESIKNDLLDGYVSEGAAKKDYGIKDIKALWKNDPA
jgi:N-methylhydantoinase B